MPPRRSTSRRRSTSTTRRRAASTPRKGSKKATTAAAAAAAPAAAKTTKVALKEEARKVDAVLSGRSMLCKARACKGFWMAVIALQVVALAWVCWSFELYKNFPMKH